MEPLRVAIVGAGGIAQQHLPVLAARHDCRVVLLCDPNAAARAETAARFVIPEQADDVAAVARRDDLDAVFVLVSVMAVAEVAARCIEAGLPTFIEKPPGLYSSETARLAELADRRGAIAMVGLNRRFYAAHLAIRERLAAIGPLATLTVEAHEDLSRVPERFAARRGGVPLPEPVFRRWAIANGIHALDLLRYFGGEVEEISAQCHSVGQPFPDVHTAAIRFASGAHGRALVDYIAPGGHRFEIRVAGARATSLPGFDGVTLSLSGQPDQVIEPDDDDRRYKPGFWKQAGAFLSGARAGRQPAFPAPSLADAHRTMALIERICGLPPAP
jgi:phthalate 4,5-cis-dihydrodiol dehydrogenase